MGFATLRLPPVEHTSTKLRNHTCVRSFSHLHHAHPIQHFVQQWKNRSSLETPPAPMYSVEGTFSSYNTRTISPTYSGTASRKCPVRVSVAIGVVQTGRGLLLTSREPVVTMKHSPARRGWLSPGRISHFPHAGCNPR